MTGVLHSIGRFSAPRRYWVIGVWVPAAIALLAICHQAGSKTSEEHPLVLESSDGPLTAPPRSTGIEETHSIMMVLLGRRASRMPRIFARFVPKIGILG
jgi:uncharacterized membrane protein YdfJ with MMPL/SSD domain